MPALKQNKFYVIDHHYNSKYESLYFSTSTDKYKGISSKNFIRCCDLKNKVIYILEPHTMGHLYYKFILNGRIYFYHFRANEQGDWNDHLIFKEIVPK